jgi:hypothetical protein
MRETRSHADSALPLGHEFERELRTIAEALENAHLLIGIAGLMLGVSAGCLLHIAGVGLFAASPALAVVLTGVLGAALGLWFGARGPGREPADIEPESRRRYHQYQ